jgi:peptidylprolyl isomerase
VAEAGNTVAVHYRGTLDNGEEFDSSHGREPLTFQVGSGQVIPGFDQAVAGMTEGESKTIRIEPNEAYGERRDDLIIAVPVNQAPDGLEVGQQVRLGDAPATVVGVDEDEVTVDANHPLAGEALNFEIELVSVQ